MNRLGGRIARTLRHRGVCASVFLALAIPATASPQNPKDMPIVGYADRLGVRHGESIRFMVSSELPRYRAEIVRLIHGDPNPNGPGIKEARIDAPVNGEYSGRYQPLPNGSYVRVADQPVWNRRLNEVDEFNLFFKSLGRQRPNGRFDRITQSERARVDLKLARLQLGKIQQIIDQLEQQIGGTLGRGQPIVLRVRKVLL